MSVQGWKWWQWVLVSLFIGVLIGWTLTNRELDDPSVPSTSLGSFMQKLRMRTDTGEPVLTKIRVSPLVADDAGKMVQVVTFWERLKNKETGHWDPVRPYRMYTHVPVFPKAPRADYGIVDFLADQKKEIPALDAGFGWWQVPRNAWLLSIGGSVLLIGVAWPLCIRAMVKLGLGNPEAPAEAGYDLSKVTARPTLRPAGPVAPNEADAAELAAINARLQSNVSDMLVKAEKRDDEAERRAEAAVVRKLSDVPLETPDTPATRNDDKSFGGEYYPVARPVNKSE